MNSRIHFQFETTLEEMEVEKSVASGSTEYEIASVAPLRRGQDSPLSEAGFVDPVTIVVTGTVAMIAVRLVNHWLKKDERGLQIDLRTRPVTISQLRNVPAGVLVIIDKDGKPLVERQTYDKLEDVLPMLTRIFASEGCRPMSRTKAFDWLSGTVTIPAHAPERWQEEGPHKGLIDFYENPNHHEWGGTLCRVLYHESIHFWQLLSSGYLANALQDEWLRLLEFEQTGNLRPTSNFVTGMLQVHTGRPFSVYELMESWARYWDVQTRSPATIVEEDQIQHDGIVLWTKEGCYTSHAFDLFMKEGKDAEFYARPYRWLLDQCEGHTRFANIAFPILVFHAFGSPRPIALLQRSLEYALKSDVVRKAALEGPAFINLDWPKNWPVFISEAIEPAARDLNMPNFTAGWDVIARGRLGSHPVYGAYRQLIRTMFSLSSLGKAEPPKKPSVQAAYEYAVVDLAARVPACVFAFPGEPVYRLALGEYVPPPRVRFNNFTLHATRNPVGKVNAALRALEDQTMRKDDFTFKSIFDEFDSRVRRFRHAEYAVSVGLPPTTFN